MVHNPDFEMMQQPTQNNEWATSLSYANDQANYTDDWLSCFVDQSSFTHIQPLSDFIDPSLEDLLCTQNEIFLKKESHYVTSPIESARHKQLPSNSLPEPLEHAHPFSATIHFSSTQNQLPEVGFVSAFPFAANDPIPPQNSVCFSDSQSLSCLLVGTSPMLDVSSDVETPSLLDPLAQNSASTLTQIIQTSVPAPAASASSGLSQSSFVDSSSHQDFWKDEEMDANVFADQAFTKDLFEPEEEIATSTIEIGSEEGQSIHTLEQNRDNLIKGIAVGTVPSKQGMESMATQVTTAKRKHLGKRKKSSHIDLEDQQSDHNDTDVTNEDGQMGGEDEEKRQARLMRNRESAQLSRQRRKVYVDELEEKLRTMTSTIAELNNTINLISAENVNLRSQVAYFYQAHGSSAKPGVLPVGFPVVPITHPGFVGARPIFPALHAPPVPIPRLKSQVPLKNSKKSKASAAGQGRSKGSLGGRTKRLIGTAAMGLCLIMVIFAPMGENPSKRESNGSNVINQGMRIGGRVLMSANQAESTSGSSHRKWEPNISWSKSTQEWLGLEQQQLDSKDQDSSEAKGVRTNIETAENSHNPSVDCCAVTGGNRNHSAEYFRSDSFTNNVSEPLAASLFFRRNDKLVKVDGSLIIQAIMAGDKAAQRSEKEESQKLHSAEPKIVQKIAGQNLAAVPNLKALEAAGLMALESPDNKGPARNDGPVLKNQKALPSKQKVPYDAAQVPNSKSSGSMQQWLLSDFAGTILSTGTCSEMFQFQASSVRGTSEANETTASGQRTMSQKKSQRSDSVRSRKGVEDLVPSTVRRYAPNRFRVREKPEAEPTKRTYRENRRQSARTRPSSMVVSVLSELHVSGDYGREQASDDSKGISNFFVVILLDSVKYVTYSCMLPSQGPQPQLVTS